MTTDRWSREPGEINVPIRWMPPPDPDAACSVVVDEDTPNPNILPPEVVFHMLSFSGTLTIHFFSTGEQTDGGPDEPPGGEDERELDFAKVTPGGVLPDALGRQLFDLFHEEIHAASVSRNRPDPY